MLPGNEPRYSLDKIKSICKRRKKATESMSEKVRRAMDRDEMK